MGRSRDSKSEAGSEHKSRATSTGSGGSQATTVIPPCPKADRYDFSGEPLKTCFNAEVMRALGSRGGALWLRFKEAEAAAKAQDDPASFADMMDGGAVSAFRANVSSEKLAQIFDLPADAKVAVNRSVVEMVFNEMQKKATELGVEELEFQQFFTCCHASGFMMQQEQARHVFSKIDTSNNGKISAQEWADLIKKAAS
jgi:hypothetical protein